MTLAEALTKEINEAARSAVREFYAPLEIFPTLPPISNTAEIAKELRVSVDILRRMTADGMPHVHAGRELRFVKSLVIEWVKTGKLFECEICQQKEPAQLEAEHKNQTNAPALGDKTTAKLARMGRIKPR